MFIIIFMCYTKKHFSFTIVKQSKFQSHKEEVIVEVKQVEMIL